MTPAALLALVAKHNPTLVGPTVALLTDYGRLRENLQRLAQAASVSILRWQRHEAACELCGDEENDESGDTICAEGVALYMEAQGYHRARQMMRGQLRTILPDEP